MKKRRPFQLSADFLEKLKEIQKGIMKKEGVKLSFPDIADRLVKNKDIENIENDILNNEKKILDFDIKLRMDKRFR